LATVADRRYMVNANNANNALQFCAVVVVVEQFFEMGNVGRRADGRKRGTETCQAVKNGYARTGSTGRRKVGDQVRRRGRFSRLPTASRRYSRV